MALQVIVVLDKPIWPPEFFDVICPGSFFPELWVTQYPANGKTDIQLYGIIGFACGHKADQISKMRDSSVVLALLRQLDEVFCKHYLVSSQNTHDSVHFNPWQTLFEFVCMEGSCW